MRFGKKTILSLSLALMMSLAMIPTVSQAAAPAAPKGFKGTAVNTTSIKLSWKKVSGAKSYVIYKKSGSKYVKLITLSGKYTSYTVKKLKANTKYYYKIAVKTAKGTSKLSAAISAKTKSASSGSENLVAKNALIKGGNWEWISSAGVMMYGFYSDGTCNFFILGKAGNYSTANYTKASFKVIGSTIYLTNVKSASADGWDRQVTNWTYTDGMDEARIKLQNVPMTSRPNRAMKYEFDKGYLRIIDGDSDVKFAHQKSFSGPFPSHRLSGVAWPSSLMPPNLSAYTQGVIGKRFDAGSGEYKNYTWDIHHTTPAALKSYIEILKTNKWNVFDGIGENSYEAQKGGYRLKLYFDKYMTLQFVAYPVDIAGAWPAGKLPAELLLPDAGFPAEKVEFDDGNWDNTQTSFGFTLDGMDAVTLNAYIAKLTANGWVLDNYSNGDTRIYTKTIFWQGQNRSFEIWINNAVQNLTRFSIWVSTVS